MNKIYPSVRYIQESEIENILMDNLTEYLNYLQLRIAEISVDSSSTWIKPKIIYDDPIHPNNGDIRSMTCFTEKVKVIKIISTNPTREKHWSVSVGATLLLDYNENYPIAFFDATSMSSIRTAALAVIGTLMSIASLDDVLVIGYGRVGSCIVEMVTSLNGKARVYDPAISKEIMLKNPNIEFYSHLDKFEAKSIIAATTSREPFLNIENTAADFIVSVGADTAFNFELDSELIKNRSSLYTDCPDAIHVGDVSRIPNAEKLICGDILDLYKNKDAKTLVSVGSPLMDALTIEFMAKKLNLI
jgi:ornithine cyclodeaminase/alanine dehydrogenase-like protein (mu-crystallin family)